MDNTKMLYNTGVVLRKLRLRKDVFQSVVAKHLDMVNSGYNRMESGDQDLKLVHICKLAEFFEIAPHELVHMIEDPTILERECNGK